MNAVTSRKTWITIKEYLIITLGLLIYAIAWVVFLIPNHLVGGGVTGIASIIYYATNLPISISYFGINALLLAVGYRVIGWRFVVKSIYGVSMASVFLQFVPMFIPQDLIQEVALANGKLIAAIIGGGISGVGVGMAISQGGSTGGTDIVAQIINKYRNVSPGRIMLICDFIIIGSSLFISDEPTVGLKIARLVYGYLIMSIASFTVDMVVSGARRSVQFFIFSDCPDQIADRISKEVHRGVTVISSKGWYTKQEHKVLFVVVRHTEAHLVSKIVKAIDKNAFLTIGSVSSVFGHGFEALKS